MKRIVSLWFPHWPIERLRRENPGALPVDAAFALVGERDRGAMVTAVDAGARRAGIAPGHGLADARALLPRLRTVAADSVGDRRALTALAHWANRYGAATALESPVVSPTGEAAAVADGLVIDITGVAHLYGGEAALLRDLLRRLRAFGLTVRPGLADTVGSASAIARHGRARTIDGCIAAAGGTAAAIAPLPAAALRLDLATITLLRRLGLKTIGDLAAVPRSSLRRRFPGGTAVEAVLLRLDQASGRRAEPLTAVKRAARYEERAVFAEPLIAAEGLMSAIGELTDRLARSLESGHAATRGLALTLARADGTAARVGAGFSRPTREPRHMLRLLAEKAATLDAGLGVDALILTARFISPLAAVQAGFAGSRAQRQAEAVAQLVDRLAGRLGNERVRQLEPAASHWPERAHRNVAAVAALPSRGAAAPAHSGLPTANRPARPPFLLSRPEPIRVLAEVPEGPPQRLGWRRTSRRITRAEGPERIAPEWWRLIGEAATAGPPEIARTRDYFTVEDDTGGRYWIFRAGLYGGDETVPAWFLHGFFG